MIEVNRRTYYLLLALLTVVAAVVQMLAARNNNCYQDCYTTQQNEERTIRLADGTWVRLHQNTTLRSRKTDGLIEIELSQGGALFDVQRGAGSLRVITPQGKVEDIGTQFEILVQNEEDEISVLEGAVWATGSQSTSSTELLAGSKSRMLSDGRVLNIPVTNSPYGAATRATIQRNYTHITYAAAADVFNRESRELRFVVEGDARTKSFAGTLTSADDFLAALQSRPMLKVTRHGQIVEVTDRQ